MPPRLLTLVVNEKTNGISMTDKMGSVSSAFDQNATPEERLARLGLVLPPSPPPIANFVSHVIEGGMMYLSGQGPREADGFLHAGRVGDTVSVTQAYAHAQLTALNLLAVMSEALGDLSRVKRVVKVLGMVNAVPGFTDHPKVINGCSDVFISVF